MTGAGFGAVVTLGLTLKSLGFTLEGPFNFDFASLLFHAVLTVVPLVPFLAAGAIGYWRRESPLLVGCLIFEACALASCWYYFRLAFHLGKPDALDALTFIFIPIYQVVGLGLLLGLGGLVWHFWPRRA